MSSIRRALSGGLPPHADDRFADGAEKQRVDRTRDRYHRAVPKRDLFERRNSLPQKQAVRERRAQTDAVDVEESLAPQAGGRDCGERLLALSPEVTHGAIELREQRLMRRRQHDDATARREVLCGVLHL